MKALKSLFLALALALTPGCAKSTSLTYNITRQSQEQQQLEQIRAQLEQAGLKIASSRAYPNSGVLIYLPDEHTENARKIQLANLWSLEQKVKPFVYFLESLYGEITPQYLEKLDKTTEKRKKSLESLTLKEFFLSTQPTEFALALRDKRCYGVENKEEFFNISLLGQADLAGIRKKLCAATIASYLERTAGKKAGLPLIQAMSSSQLSDYLKIQPIDQNLKPVYNGLVELMKEQERIQTYLESHGIKNPRTGNVEDYIYKLKDARSIAAARNIKKQLASEQISVLIYGALHEPSLLREFQALKQSYIVIDTGFR